MPRIREPQGFRNDATLCKVKVKNRSRSRSRSRSRVKAGSRSRSRSRSRNESRQKYVIKGRGKSVVLEFTQKNNFGGGFKTTGNRRGRDANRNGYIHRSAGKRLGQSVGVSEFKRRAQHQQVKNGKGGTNDNAVEAHADDGDDLAREIEQLRQIQNDQDVGYTSIDVEEEIAGNDADKDTGWFHLDTSKGNDFFKSFLNDVKCTAYTTDRRGCDNEGGPFTCAASTDKQEVVIEQREDEANAMVENIENYDFQERDLQEELREMEDYKQQQEELKLFMNEEMERINREGVHEDGEKRRQQEAVEKLEKIKREEEEMKKEQEAEELRNQLEAMDMDRIKRDVEDMKKMQQHENEKKQKQVEAEEEGEEENQRQHEETHPRSDGTDEEGVKDSNGKDNNTNWLGTLSRQLVNGYTILKCGENMEVLDMFDWTKHNKNDDDNSRIVEKAIYPADDHQDSPPTALYAAIGTQNWNIAIRRLLDEPVEASTWVSNASVDGENVYRFLPLHIACLSSAPLLLVTLLLQTYPNAAKYNAMGKLPIHMACETLADHRIVFLLLNAWPESINIKDGDGYTPIEVASFHDPCEERKQIIQVLTKKMECTVVKMPTPLYAAVDSQHWNFAIKRLVEMPQEATVWVSFTKKTTEVRFLPLHIACHLGAPYFLISDLVHAYPDAVRKKTTQGKLPLHIACEHHDDERVVKLLLKFWPEGLFVKDDEGNTALEIVKCVEFSPERTSIIALLQKKLEHQDKVVFSPTELYAFIEKRKWDAAVRKCLESQDQVSTWVGSCQKKKDAKLLPLHVACSSRAPLILIAVLIQSYTENVKRTTNAGKLPIHLACENRADHRIVSLLLHTFPDSCKKKDERGNTPVQTALLASPSPERTKIVEILMAFEAKSGENLLSVPNSMIDEIISQEPIINNKQLDETEKNTNTKKNTNKKNTIKKRGTKKSRKANQNNQTWGTDDNMLL